MVDSTKVARQVIKDGQFKMLTSDCGTWLDGLQFRMGSLVLEHILGMDGIWLFCVRPGHRWRERIDCPLVKLAFLAQRIDAERECRERAEGLNEWSDRLEAVAR